MAPPLGSVVAIELVPLPRGWPDPFTVTMARGQDYQEAIVSDGEVWIKFGNGWCYRVPLAHVLYTIPHEWHV